MGTPRSPRRTCPVCKRPNLAVWRSRQQLRAHDHPDGGRCTGSDVVIDLYAEEV